MFSVFTQLPPIAQTVILLCISNTIMFCAWYGHLRYVSPNRTWLFAVVLGWGIAFFEYLFNVPANRIGYQVMSVAQLKILQEVISLVMFIPFMMLVMKEPLKMNYIYAGCCMVGAVYFMFRD